MIDRVRQLADEHFSEVVRIRHHLHAHPELSFQEKETAKFVVEELKRLGLEVNEGLAGTGVVAMVHGASTGGPCVALRADLDALPITEQNDVPYRSRNEGVMHACGHDVHTANLLGAARILGGMKEELNGSVKLIFQPGEEKLPGGASLMIKEGVLNDPEPRSMFGQHVTPEIPVGKVAVRPGPFMASADEIYLTVKGKGGHAAMPNKLIDPVLITSHLIVALQQLVSRRALPGMPTVLSFGKVIAEGATNIISSEVHVAGTLRTFDEEWRKECHALITDMCVSLARSLGGECDVDLRVGYPVLINDEATTARARSVAEELLGKENVIDIPQRMGGEDFAFYTHHVPATFLRLGTGGANGEHQSGLHTPTFDVDERAMQVGSALMAAWAISELQT